MSRIVIFTNTFPYGTAETFLNEELPFVAAKFSEVYIYPLYIPDEKLQQVTREVPGNVTVCKPLLNFSHKNKKQMLKSGLLCNAPIFFAIKEAFVKRVFLSGNKLWQWGNYLLILRSIIGNKVLYREVLNCIKTSNVAYFYWGDKSALIIPFVKRKLKNSTAVKFVVRFHGSDIYEQAKGYLPFREMLYKSIDYAVPISNNGAKYIKENYKNQPANICVHHLGSYDHNSICPNLTPDNFIAQPDDTPFLDAPKTDKIDFNIVSCSNVIELKRIDLIAKALLLIEKDISFQERIQEKGFNGICWYHLGDGPLLGKIKSLFEEGLPVFTKASFLGAVPHSAVIQFYMNHKSHLFVQVSRSEGIPVSIMEALSFGTPVIATNVGGVSELFDKPCSSSNENCKEFKYGTLLPADFKIELLAEIIKNWVLKEDNVAFFARAQWEKNWNATKNYSLFADFLVNL